MANKFTQGKAGEALAYPKTLAEAVFLEENGESIKKVLDGLPVNGEVIAVALILLDEAIGKVKKDTLVPNDLAKTDEEVQGATKKVLSVVYGRFLKSLSDTNEEILATSLNLINALSAVASAVAPAHSRHTAYSVGDIVSKDGRFYECIVAHTGLWDATKWEQTTLIEYIRKYFQPITQ